MADMDGVLVSQDVVTHDGVINAAAHRSDQRVTMTVKSGLRRGAIILDVTAMEAAQLGLALLEASRAAGAETARRDHEQPVLSLPEDPAVKR